MPLALIPNWVKIFLKKMQFQPTAVKGQMLMAILSNTEFPYPLPAGQKRP